MKQKQLIKKLDKISTKVATNLVNIGVPISKGDGSILVGKTTVVKNKHSFYDVILLDKKVLYTNIATIGIAAIIAEKYNKKEVNSLRRVIELESAYSKNFIDVLYYRHSIHNAILRKDYDTVDILNTRLDLTNARLENLKTSILKFKSTK